MGRFHWLEMDAKPGRRAGKPPQGEGPSRYDLDEARCLEQAEGALRQGEYETALQWFSRALRFAIDLEPAWVGQVVCLLLLEEYPEANIWADRALQRFQDSPDLLAAKALALARMGKGQPMAYSDASLAVKGREGGGVPWAIRADVLLNLKGNVKGAERCVAKAQELAAGQWVVYLFLGRACLQSGILEQAVSVLREGVRVEPGSSALWCLLGQAHERQGEVHAAMEAYRQAARLHRRCKEARVRLAMLEHAGALRRLWWRLFRK